MQSVARYGIIVLSEGGVDMSKGIDLDKVAEHLGYEQEGGDAVVSEAKVDVKPVARIIEATVSYKISPRGTYSSAEVSKTVEINSDNGDTVRGIVEQLKTEVLKDTVEAASMMLKKAREEDLI